eukprot:1178955-Prorocentrum_minimum.AAC.1
MGDYDAINTELVRHTNVASYHKKRNTGDCAAIDTERVRYTNVAVSAVRRRPLLHKCHMGDHDAINTELVRHTNVTVTSFHKNVTRATVPPLQPSKRVLEAT